MPEQWLVLAYDILPVSCFMLSEMGWLRRSRSPPEFGVKLLHILLRQPFSLSDSKFQRLLMRQGSHVASILAMLFAAKKTSMDLF